MKFKQHYSGSAGNLYEIIASNGKRLLIDAGVRWKKEVLPALKFKLNGIEACLFTHSHQDHCKAIRGVKKAGIDIYASGGTLEKLKIDTGRKVTAVRNKDLIRLKSFEVLCFDTIHDAPEPLGFVIREKSTGEYLLFITDTKCVKQRFKYAFSIVALECSFNGEYLAEKVAAEKINESLAKRLLDSHLEERECLRYLQEFCDLAVCREVHLLHLSANNIHKERIKNEFESKLFVEVVTV
jgi:phosphoribosyl 1,2-cyclic phosphodiesterase